jgi:phosphoserine aminotransferase
LVKKSIHYFNGEFGKKWFEYSDKIQLACAVSFSTEEDLPVYYIEGDVVAITQNETSNGTSVAADLIRNVKNQNLEKLIAVDATSSMAGISLPFDSADIWFASVQKCFGLPSGLALLICSPQALQKSAELNEKNHYNSLEFLKEKMASFQTSYTPNVLGIFLLNRILNIVPSIEKTDKIIRERAVQLYDFFNSNSRFNPLVKNDKVRSETVICLEGEEKDIASIKEKALANGILLGNGYGKWSENTFRIANFPAHTDQDFETLLKFFKSI